MKEIFENMKGEWDWFGIPEKIKATMGLYTRKILTEGIPILDIWLENEERGDLYPAHQKSFSLADLLANKSWCKAVWGKDWKEFSLLAFKALKHNKDNTAISNKIFNNLPFQIEKYN